MKLSKNEQLVLQILRENPYISQKDLALNVHLSRPAVANLISGLQQKGYILGKPYILRTEQYITCVGGTNIDYTFKLVDELIPGTSNPITSSISFGGVIRNVAENLARLESKVSLMSIVGEDAYGETLIRKSNDLMETFAIDTIRGETTGGYYSIIELTGNMNVGFADMSINRFMDRSWILSHKRHLNMSSMIVADLNLKEDAVESLIEFSRNENIPLAIVGVSSPKMKHLPKDIEGVEVLICNKDETQTYFNTRIEKADKLCQLWLEAGVKKAVVTDGTNGTYYGQGSIVNHQKAFLIEQRNIIDVTGAGDAFSAAMIYGLSKNYSFKEAVQMGAVSSSLTIQEPYSVNPKLSINLIQKELEKHEIIS